MVKKVDMLDTCRKDRSDLSNDGKPLWHCRIAKLCKKLHVHPYRPLGRYEKLVHGTFLLIACNSSWMPPSLPSHFLCMRLQH